jgi:hypothetical protein
MGWAFLKNKIKMKVGFIGWLFEGGFHLDGYMKVGFIGWLFEGGFHRMVI